MAERAGRDGPKPPGAGGQAGGMDGTRTRENFPSPSEKKSLRGARDDLPLVAKLADQAHTFIFERFAESKSEEGE